MPRKTNAKIFLLTNTIYFAFRIIKSFEGIVNAVVNQENFTNVTVVEEDIAFRGERVSLLFINNIYFYFHFCRLFNQNLVE